MSLSWDWDDGDSEELAALRDLVRRFIDKEIAPHHARWEREGQVSRELWRKAGELGLLCMGLPAELGGSQADFGHSAVMVQELARSGFTGPLFHLHSEIVAPYLHHYGTPEQQQTWLPRMAWGEVISAAKSGVIDGGDLPVVNMDALKVYEVSKFCSLTYHNYGPTVNVMNLDTWNALTPVQQKLIMELSREAQNKIRASTESVDNFAAAKKLLEPRGMTVVETNVEAFRKLAQQKIWPQYKPQYGALWDEIENFKG